MAVSVRTLEVATTTITRILVCCTLHQCLDCHACNSSETGSKCARKNRSPCSPRTWQTRGVQKKVARRGIYKQPHRVNKQTVSMTLQCPMSTPRPGLGKVTSLVSSLMLQQACAATSLTLQEVTLPRELEFSSSKRQRWIHVFAKSRSLVIVIVIGIVIGIVIVVLLVIVIVILLVIVITITITPSLLARVRAPAVFDDFEHPPQRPAWEKVA